MAIEGAALPMASHMASVALFGQQDNRNALVQWRNFFFHSRKYLQPDQVVNKKTLVIGIGGMGTVVAQMLAALQARDKNTCGSYPRNLHLFS